MSLLEGVNCSLNCERASRLLLLSWLSRRRGGRSGFAGSGRPDLKSHPALILLGVVTAAPILLFRGSESGGIIRVLGTLDYFDSIFVLVFL